MASPHEPLELAKAEIRLLKLQPGPNDSDLKVKLVHASLDSNPDYEALSYTWGDPHFTTPIEILSPTDYSASFTFNATHNLISALNALRSPTAARILWVDAICIN